jgi:hypothetical protein
MAFENKVGLKGHLKIYTQEQGKDWELYDEVDNLVTYAGINRILATMLNGTNNAYFGYIAVSTSTAAPSASNTTLPGEVFRTAIDHTAADTGNRNITITSILTFAQANGNSLTKYGMFSAATLGTLLNETNHISITKTASIQVKYEYTLSMV